MSENDRLMTLVATRHYLEGRSRIEIAHEIGISRFAVARLLEQARELGIVRFQIASPDDLDLSLSAKMRTAFALRHALVVQVPPANDQVVRQRLGRAAARLLEELLRPGEVIGVSGGRTLHETVRCLERLPQADIVQLAGVTEGPHEGAVEFVRHLARISGGNPFMLLAPLLTQSNESGLMLRREPAICDAYARFADVTTAVVGVGSWVGSDSPLGVLAEQLGLKEHLAREGVVADVGSVFLTQEGEEVSTFAERRIAITGAELRRVPEVLAVAGGQEKRGAVRAALHSGIISSLVCDAGTALALLAEQPSPPPRQIARGS